MKNLSEKEKELIEMIRNYKKTYPKSKNVEFYILQLFETLLYDNDK